MRRRVVREAPHQLCDNHNDAAGDVTNVCVITTMHHREGEGVIVKRLEYVRLDLVKCILNK